jgi:PadR family transcriptional regulator PadR
MALPLVDKIERDLSNGTSWLVVLAAIARSSEPVHGYEIARQLSEESPEGLISSTLVPSNEGPARKCFRLTADGRRTLSAWIRLWKDTDRWVNRVISGTGLTGGSNVR